MLSRLISFSLAQRAFIVGATLFLAIAGIWSASNLPIDAFPEIAPTQVKVILKAPGMTPEEVEARIVRPLEQELLGIPNQTVMRAMAKYGIADVTIDFKDGTDVYWARQQTSERLSAVQDILPDTVEGGLAPVSTALSELFMFTIEGGDLSLEERRSLLDWVIRPSLRTLPGVADVNSLGGRVKTYDVVPNEKAMSAAGVSLEQLYDTVISNNLNDGAGRIQDGEESLVVRTIGSVTNEADIGNLVIRENAGSVLRIKDVARVQTGALTRYGSVTKDGTGEAVEGIVVALKGADARMVVRGVEERLEALKPGLPDGVEIAVFYNRSDLINKAVGTVTQALIMAAILVIGLLVLFLGNLRAAIVVALSLPFAALSTFLLMRTTGLSANLMSLGGLAIAVGMIVDSAIVVTENSVERLNASTSANKLHIIYRAVGEVALPTAAGTLIICLVFLPLLTLEGLEGKLFAPVALAIVFALGSALLLAFTLIPVLASFMLKANDGRPAFIMRLLSPAYEKALNWALKLPALVYGVTLIAVCLAVLSYGRIGKTFMPTMNEGAVVMQLASLPSIGLRQSEADDLRIEKALIERVPEVKHVISRVGSDELGLDPMPLNESDVFLELAPREEWRGPDTDWLVGEIRKVTADFIGIETSFTQPIEMRVSELLTGSRGDVAIKIFGPDSDKLADLAGQIEKVISGVQGAADVYTTSNDVAEYLQIETDFERVGLVGMTSMTLQRELRARLEGVRAGEVIGADRRTPILIRSDSDDRATPYGFDQSKFVAPGGQLISLSELATVRRAEGLATVERENGARFSVVEAFVQGRDLVGFVTDAQEAVQTQVQIPPGYRIEFGGEFQNQKRAAARLSMMIPLSLGLIFVVLFAALRSVRQSLLILFNIPLALIGGVIALYLSGEYLSVPASIGFIALLGIAVLNGLVLVTYFNDLRRLGYSLDETIRKGAVRRLRPVLMTATTAGFGLMPLLFAAGPGSEIQKPLAIVVIGGLISSTLLTLFLLPLLYRKFGTRHGDNYLTKEVSWTRPYAN